MKIWYKGLIYESIGHSNNLVVVDIQPEYRKGFTFKPLEFGNWINQNVSKYNKVVFLYNGPELGFPEESEYIYWLVEECGIDEDVIGDIVFFDKGYAFFRNPMDAGSDKGHIISLVKWMMSNNINDSRDISEEQWNDINLPELRENLEGNDDALFIPDVLKLLSGIYGPIDLMGGGRNECLAEVEICLMALVKNYKLIEQFTY